MRLASSWDWEPGDRVVLESTKCSEEHEWQEEFYASPDGERLACAVKLSDFEYGVWVNGEVWESRFDRVWYPRFGPDGRLTVLVNAEMDWTVATEDQPWDETYAYVWDTRFSDDGSRVAVAVQQDGKYGMAVNGELWPTLYDNANNFALSMDGSQSAAAVQVESMGQADINKFMAGVFSLAVDGKAWDKTFMNVWTPVFSPDSRRVAAQARLNHYEYSLAVDGGLWPETYQMIWEPVFNASTGQIAAPVRLGGKWGMALDGLMAWKPKFLQCWQPRFSRDGKRLAAIVATDYGAFTVAIDAKPWAWTLPVLDDLVLSDDGSSAAARGKDGDEKWTILQNGAPWHHRYDMVFTPAISPDGAFVAAKVEKKGRYRIAVNGHELEQTFETAWDPTFSPDGTKVLVRGLDQGKFLRMVVPVEKYRY
ncbi:MAG: electron transfer complex subunit TmcD [Desulfovibrionaceae bacterium]